MTNRTWALLLLLAFPGLSCRNPPEKTPHNEDVVVDAKEHKLAHREIIS